VLFEQAAHAIGCQLTVTRLPKKRLHKMLAEGKLDFYPGASFSEKRSKYLYYIENGLSTGEFGITGLDVPELSSYQDLQGTKLIWLMELNSSKSEIAKSLGVEIQQLKYVNLDIVRKFIHAGRPVFYVADKELVDFYPKRSGVASFEEAGMKEHEHCCGGSAPMYMGFSRFSPLFKEKKNPEFNKDMAVSVTNFPTVVDHQSIAYKFGEALAALKKSGETAELHKKYF
jgi:hypothetical protein